MTRRLAWLLVTIGTSPVAFAQWPTMDQAAPTQVGGSEDAALIVAIGRYGELDPIEGADDNANAWYDYFHRTRGIPTERLRMLRDRDARDHQIREKASEIGRLVGRRGTVWFVFIGHGAPGPPTPTGEREGLLVGYDASPAADLSPRSVQLPDLLKRLGARGRPVVAVVDACFSGRTARGAIAKNLQPAILAKSVRGLDARSSATVLSAGGSDQYAGPLPGGARPAFSYLVLGALRGWGRSVPGDVSPKDAVAYARRILEPLLKTRRQTPEVYGRHAARALTRVNRPERGPDPATLAKQLAGGTDWRASPGVEEVIVSFRSTPSGSTVTVDGRSLCNTPCKRQLPVGARTVSMAMPRHLQKSEIVTLTRGLELDWTLTPDFGTVRLTVTPPTVALSLDGRPLASPGARPLELAPGTHRLAVADPCFVPTKRAIEVVRGEQVSVELAPDPRLAGLKLSARDPSGNYVEASVLLDGKRIGQTPGTFTVPLCARELVVRHPGYADVVWPLRLAERQTADVIVDLRRAEAPKPVVPKAPPAPPGYAQVPPATGRLWVARTEVTQAQWQAVTQGLPSWFHGCPECPVEQISIYDAMSYANRLSAREGLTPCYTMRNCQGQAGYGMRCGAVFVDHRTCTGYRLLEPSEWAAAARATSPGAAPDDLDDSVWYEDNTSDRTRPVDGKDANAWGLYDMPGNVREWVYDSATARIGTMGCSWMDIDEQCRFSSFVRTNGDERNPSIGFRLARNAPRTP